jgi:GH24 family phage-related lysozyme (muramidase)
MTWIDDARELIERHEGRRAAMYHDDLGIPTIGVGFNLNRTDARVQLCAVGADYEQVITLGASLTDAEIDALLSRDVGSAVNDLSIVLPSFGTLPDQVKVALTDMRFNLGPARFRGFAHMIAFVRQLSFRAASEEMLASVWAKQVPARAQADAQLVRSASLMDDEPTPVT